MSEFDQVLSRIQGSNLSGTPRMLAQLAVACGLPVGEGPGDDADRGIGEKPTRAMAPPLMGYRIHPALIYGGWVNPAKRNRGSQPQKRGEVVLGVPTTFHPKIDAMQRAQAVSRSRMPLVEHLQPAVVTTPKELGPRHSRLLVGLLLDLVSRCAGKSLELVIQELETSLTFRHRIDQKDLRQLVGRDLPLNDALLVLDDLRRTVWSIPIRIQTWEKDRFVDRDFNMSIPGITAVPSPKQDDNPWVARSQERPEDDNREFQSRPFDGDTGKCRSTLDIFWDARILGWCWSTAQFLAKKKSLFGQDAILAFKEKVLDEVSPVSFRDILFSHMTEITRDHLRMGLEETHNRVRSADLLRDVYGTTSGAEVEKLARRAGRRSEAREDGAGGGAGAVVKTPSKPQRVQNGVTPSLFSETSAGLAPELTPTPTKAGLAPTSAGLAPGGIAEFLSKSSFCATCVEKAAPQEKTTKEQDNEGKAKQLPSPLASPALPTAGILLVKKSPEEKATDLPLGGGQQEWRLGVIPVDGLGRPWSKGEVDAYFQTPVAGRVLPEAILHLLVEAGFTFDRVQAVRDQSCFTDMGIQAVVEAVNRAALRGRVDSPAALINLILTNHPVAKTLNWLSDHHRANRTVILARAGARSALLAIPGAPGWVRALPVDWITPETTQVVRNYLASDPGTNVDTRRALGTALLPIVPDPTRSNWTEAFARHVVETNLSSLVARHKAGVCLGIEALVYFGALPQDAANRLSPSRAEIFGPPGAIPASATMPQYAGQSCGG